MMKCTKLNCDRPKSCSFAGTSIIFMIFF